jgi:hypothetical protein
MIANVLAGRPKDMGSSTCSTGGAIRESTQATSTAEARRMLRGREVRSEEEILSTGKQAPVNTMSRCLVRFNRGRSAGRSLEAKGGRRCQPDSADRGHERGHRRHGQHRDGRRDRG